MKKRILLFVDWYEPGFKAGGPIQSCLNIVKKLQDRYEFYIFTSDRDLGESTPYPHISVNCWITGSKGEHIFYASPDFLKLQNITDVIHAVQPAVIYFNSMFSKYFTLIPITAIKRAQYRGKVVLAPRGMLQAGALQQKGIKKKFFLYLFRLSGRAKKIVFHATDKQEKKDILKFLPNANEVVVAENIPNSDHSDFIYREKRTGILHMIFISRIHSKKNLLYLLELLSRSQFTGTINLDVYGVVDDISYEHRCRQLAARLPQNIQVHFKGALANTLVFDTLHKYHLFVLPTLGENFGHAIFEALSSGTPVLISDQTPWRNIEKEFAGWDISLQQPDRYVMVIDKMLKMDEQAYSQWTKGARLYAERFLTDFDFVSKYSVLFQ